MLQGVLGMAASLPAWMLGLSGCACTAGRPVEQAGGGAAQHRRPWPGALQRCSAAFPPGSPPPCSRAALPSPSANGSLRSGPWRALSTLNWQAAARQVAVQLGDGAMRVELPDGARIEIAKASLGAAPRSACCRPAAHCPAAHKVTPRLRRPCEPLLGPTPAAPPSAPHCPPHSAPLPGPRHPVAAGALHAARHIRLRRQHRRGAVQVRQPADLHC